MWPSCGSCSGHLLPPSAARPTWLQEGRIDVVIAAEGCRPSGTGALTTQTSESVLTSLDTELVEIREAV